VKAVRAAAWILVGLTTATALSARGRDTARPAVVELEARREPNAVHVSYRLQGCLPDEVMERIQSGIPLRFRHRIEVVEKRPGLFVGDRVFARSTIEARVHYDSLTQRYELSRQREIRGRDGTENDPSPEERAVTDDVDEMRGWLTMIDESARLDPTRELAEDTDLWVRVEVSLGRRWFLLIVPTTQTVSAELLLVGGGP